MNSDVFVGGECDSFCENDDTVPFYNRPGVFDLQLSNENCNSNYDSHFFDDNLNTIKKLFCNDLDSSLDVSARNYHNEIEIKQPHEHGNVTLNPSTVYSPMRNKDWYPIALPAPIHSPSIAKNQLLIAPLPVAKRQALIAPEAPTAPLPIEAPIAPLQDANNQPIVAKQVFDRPLVVDGMIKMKMDAARMKLTKSFIIPSKQRKDVNIPVELVVIVSNDRDDFSVYPLIVPVIDTSRHLKCVWCKEPWKPKSFYFLPFCSEHRYCTTCAVYMSYAKQRCITHCGVNTGVKCYDRRGIFVNWGIPPSTKYTFHDTE